MAQSNFFPSCPNLMPRIYAKGPVPWHRKKNVFQIPIDVNDPSLGILNAIVFVIK